MTGTDYSGGIAGWNSGTITNCYNTGAVGTETSGGIAGVNYGPITNCYNTGDVAGTDYSGGITGDNGMRGDEFVGTITNCYNTGTVNGYGSGGIAGKNEDVTIENCYNAGDVTANSTNNDAYSGGIAGFNKKGIITNCYNTGDVTATVAVTPDADSTNDDAYSGGIAGNNNQGTITNCYNTGDVTGTATADSTSTNSSARSGGVVGLNEGGTITNCYNTGDVTATVTVTPNADSTNYEAYSGGVVGSNYDGTITNCYNTGDVTVTVTDDSTSTNSSARSGGVVGLNEGGTITNCYNSGVVKAESTTGTETSGGIAGYNSTNGKITNCYSMSNGNQKLIGNYTGAAGCKTFDENGKFSDGSKLLDALNEWVEETNKQNPDKYRYWMNEKYPVFTDWYGEAKRLHESDLDNPDYTLSKNSNGIYVIENEYQLALIADNLNGNYVLSDNINLSGYEWRPIGNSSNKFNGTFDGRGHTISNLLVNINSNSDKVYSGLFGYLDSNTTVKNLGIIDSVIFTNTNYNNDDRAFSGGIAGYNTGTVMNCYNTGTVIGSGTVTFGGIVGENSRGTVINCYNTGTVIGTETSGGIAGYNSGTVMNCYNTGDVIATTTSGDANSGGIVGNNANIIKNCYNIGKVTATATDGEAFSGGITGNNSGQFGNNGTIENCYNTEYVTGTGNTVWSGGIAGYNDEGKITNCYNTGAVNAKSTNNDATSGGIAGQNSGTITNCYNIGKVTATATDVEAFSGGIAGWNYADGTITNCYYLKGCVLNGTNEGTELTSDAMNGLNLLGVDSNNNLNKEQDPKPWSPDIFNVNDGYPILADVPTQIDPSKSANTPPQSVVYVTLDSETAQAENYLKPFIGTNGDEVTATINCLNNQTGKITSYQWYEMNDEGVFIETNEIPSPSKIIHGTYCVKVTSSDGYSYTSLTRTVLNIITVTFESNGGSDVGKIETYYNETISQPEGPTKTGYEFEWWCSDKELSNKYDFDTPVTKNTTLYAKWKTIEYTVKYHDNGSTSGTVPIDTLTYTIGNTINLASNDGNLAKSGYIFRGWNYTLNASSALPLNITLSESVIENYINTIPNNTTLTLYAVWTPIPEPIYTLCLNSNDSTLQTKRYSGTYGTEVTLKSASDFGWNSEYKFIEWNSKSDGSGISYKEGDKFSLGSETWNLYAIWSDSSYHTVSFDSNGGNSIPSQSIQDGYRASEPTDPEKQGYSFKHWSLNGTTYDFNQSVKEDITLKAEYEIISYKVTFYYNGEVYYSTQADYNTSLGDRMPSLPSDKDKWNTSENGKGNNFTADSLITSDISIYAVSENSISSILIIGGSAAAILAAIAAWMFMRSRYN